MLRIRDFYPGSKFFSSRVQGQKYPGSGSASKNFSIFSPKIVSKPLEIWSEMFIPDQDLDLLPIPDPGYRGQKGTGSWILDPGSATLCSASLSHYPCAQANAKKFRFSKGPNLHDPWHVSLAQVSDLSLVSLSKIILCFSLKKDVVNPFTTTKDSLQERHRHLSLQ